MAEVADPRIAGSERSSVRLAEVIAALSLATDLGIGQPMEHVLRSCRISLRQADELALDEDSDSRRFELGQRRPVLKFSPNSTDVRAGGEAAQASPRCGDSVRCAGG